MLEGILSAAELNPDDVVVEVGPGLGVLTSELAKQAGKVIAIELDSRLVNILRKRLSSFPNVKIIHGDILKFDPRQLLKDDLAAFHCEPKANRLLGYKVVTNLPYYITSPLLRHFLEASLKPSVMVVMVQKEIGEAIAANPVKMSLLSVRSQFYSKPIVITDVPAKSFYPSPKVDSMVLRLDVYLQPLLEVSDADSFFSVVVSGFSSPRKQLRNSLAQALKMSSSHVALILEEVGIEAKRRAETLSLEEWIRLWKVLRGRTLTC